MSHGQRFGDHRTMRIDADGASSSTEEDLAPEPGMRTACPQAPARIGQAQFTDEKDSEKLTCPESHIH